MDGLRRLQLAQEILRELMNLISQIERYQAEKEKLKSKIRGDEKFSKLFEAVNEKNARLMNELNELIENRESQRTALERDLAAQLEEFNEWARRQAGFSLTNGPFNIARIRHREYILGELLADLDIAILEVTRFLH